MNNDKSITKIMKAIEQLNSESKTVTYSAVGELCGMSKQRVHQVMKMNEISTGRTHDKGHSYLEKLKDVATENLTVFEIAEVLSYKKAIGTLRHVLHLFNIKCKRSPGRTGIREFLLTVQTENYTIDELCKLANYSRSKHSFRSFLRYNKIKYKKVRST